MSQAASAELISPETIGEPKTEIPVELSTRFLEHFSEQLYSSPQKAFEELISNGWDAGADFVEIRIPSDLANPSATLCVLDNGASMDEEGLKALWHIAFSPKQHKPVQNGRHVIGKFGIGKLATYVLAKKLTYICKADDGIIRRVTMDYGVVDQKSDSDRLISELKLQLYVVTEEEVQDALANVVDGDVILSLIKNGVKNDAASLETPDDYGGVASPLERQTGKTWTLAVLSDLKPTGRELKVGHLKRMLEAALPFGSEMAIRVNGNLLASSKINTAVTKDWIIGPSLGITEIDLEESGNDEADEESESKKPSTSKLQVTSGTDPYPYVELPEVGRVTGRAKLFAEKVSAGKSEERGASNGFHVNVLGRVVNQLDPSFGEENLSHAAWARFRMTVRADGLNPFLTTNREQFREQRALKIFRAFLRKTFNIARQQYDSDPEAELPHGGDVLVQSLGVLSLSPLRSVVSETLRTQAPLPGIFDESGIPDREAKRQSWRDNTADNIRNALDKVKYEKSEDDSFVKFRLRDNTIVVNKDHPFVAEHSRTKAEKELLRTVAMVNLLSDVYALDVGIDPNHLRDVRDYRDRLMRFRALQRRKSGTYIAKLLLQTQHESDASKKLEAVVSDALSYLGFRVTDLAKPGEPEGIASAFPTPTRIAPTDDEPEPPLYSFSFDAKSSKHEAAKTGNLCLDGVVEHRNRYKAKYALVVAPGFQQGAVSQRCGELKVTPMKGHDLGRLLEFTVEYGALPLDELEQIFRFHDPDKLTKWVDELGEQLKTRRRLSIDVFLKALDALKGKVPDALSASTIALTIRDNLKVPTVMEKDVISLVRGLAILVPDLIGIEDDKVVVNASAERVAAAVQAQLEKLHAEDEAAPLEESVS